MLNTVYYRSVSGEREWEREWESSEWKQQRIYVQNNKKSLECFSEPTLQPISWRTCTWIQNTRHTYTSWFHTKTWNATKQVYVFSSNFHPRSGIQWHSNNIMLFAVRATSIKAHWHFIKHTHIDPFAFSPLALQHTNTTHSTTIHICGCVSVSWLIFLFAECIRPFDCAFDINTCNGQSKIKRKSPSLRRRLAHLTFYIWLQASSSFATYVFRTCRTANVFHVVHLFLLLFRPKYIYIWHRIYVHTT